MGRQKIRSRIRFYGRVQGVGFRYHARHLADMLGLTGWVRNCYDGSVEMEVQGDEPSIGRMLELLEQDTWIRIDRMEKKPLPVREEEKSFQTRL